MNCADFERALESHGAGPGARALAHAARCARCARALDVERRLEVALGAAPAGEASDGFTDRVMSRLSTPPGRDAAAPHLALPLAFDARPEWARLVGEPAVAAAVVLALLLVPASRPLLATGTTAAHALSAWGVGAWQWVLASVPALAGEPGRLAAWTVAASLFAVASVPLGRGVAALVAPPRAR